MIRSLTVVAACAAAIGCAVGWFDGSIRRSGDPVTWRLVSLALGAALVALPPTAMLKSLGQAIGIAIPALAIEIAASVIVGGCRGWIDCVNNIVPSLLAPLFYLYAFITVPVCFATWLLLQRKAASR